jgi:SulP family sulfate permease
MSASQPLPSAAGEAMPLAPRRRSLAERAFGSWTRSVDRRTLRADLLAGLLGALLVLPQAFAFSTLAGLPPQMGLAAAIVPCAVAALFGSSRHVVSGPTNAISLALLATLAPIAVVGSHSYVELALAVTLLVGAMQLAMALLRLGGVAHFISPSTLRGFTTGAALLIVIHALTDLLGLKAPARHGIVALLEHLGAHIDGAAWSAGLVGLVAVLVPLAVKRWHPAWPHYLIGLAAATGLGVLLDRYARGLPGWQALTVVGPIPSPWPVPHVPQIDFRLLPDLLAIAFAITIVALGQSISIAKAVAIARARRSMPTASSAARASPTSSAASSPPTSRAARSTARCRTSRLAHAPRWRPSSRRRCCSDSPSPARPCSPSSRSPASPVCCC